MDPNYANFNEIKVRHWRLLSWDEYRRYVLLISSVVILCSSIISIIIIIWATYKNDDSGTRTLSTRDPAENEKNEVYVTQSLKNIFVVAIIALVHILFYGCACFNTTMDSLVQFKNRYIQNLHCFNMFIIKLSDQNFGVSTFWKLKYVANAKTGVQNKVI